MKVEGIVYVIGLCLGIVLVSGFRQYTVSVAVGIVFVLVSLLGIASKVGKLMKEFKKDRKNKTISK